MKVLRYTTKQEMNVADFLRQKFYLIENYSFGKTTFLKIPIFLYPTLI